MTRIGGFFAAFLIFAIFVQVAWSLPGKSLYTVPLSWSDDQNKTVTLSTWQGSNVVVIMAYTRCKSACPIAVERLRKLDSSLREKGKQAEFVVVSLDPANDTVESMQHFKAMHKLDGQQWHLLTGPEENVRVLSVLLGINYQRDPKTQEIMHSNKIVLLDKQGEIEFSLEGLASDIAELVEKVEN
jgi:protein SCO1/2